MFEWLDQVCANTPSQALDVASAELGKKSPSLFVIADTLGRARLLLKRYRGKDKDELRKRHEILATFLEQVEAAQAEAILGGIDAEDKNGFGEWMPHFRAVHQSLASSSSWRKTVKKQIALARKHQKMAAAALELLGKSPGSKTYAQALKIWETSALAPSYPDLEMKLAELAGGTGNVRGKDAERFKELVQFRAATEKSGKQRAQDITSQAAAGFRDAHPDLVPENN